MRYTKPIVTGDERPETRSALLKRYKAFLKFEEARIMLRHRRTDEGLRICQERTDLIDHVVQCLWKDLPTVMDPPPKQSPPVALVQRVATRAA